MSERGRHVGTSPTTPPSHSRRDVDPDIRRSSQTGARGHVRLQSLFEPDDLNLTILLRTGARASHRPAPHAVVPGAARSYLNTRGRTQLLAVVLGCTRSYVKASLRYDLAREGTTAQAHVRPREPRKQRDAPYRGTPRRHHPHRSTPHHHHRHRRRRRHRGPRAGSVDADESSADATTPLTPNEIRGIRLQADGHRARFPQARQGAVNDCALLGSAGLLANCGGPAVPARPRDPGRRRAGHVSACCTTFLHGCGD